MRVIAVGALLIELDQLQQDEELPDDQDRSGRRVQHQIRDVDEGDDGDDAGEEARHRREAPGVDQPCVQRDPPHRQHPHPRPLRRQRETAHAHEEQEVKGGFELADVVHVSAES